MRTFIAIDIPAGIRIRIAELIDKLKPLAPAIRWSRVEGLHITLKFLGEVPQPRIGDVQRQLASISVLSGLSIAIEGAGYFPNASSPRVIWLGIKADPGLAALASQVENTMSALGYEKETRPFAPHLTVARANGARIRLLQDELQRTQPLNFGEFITAEFFLYESRPGKGGSEYIKLAKFGASAGARD